MNLDDIINKLNKITNDTFELQGMLIAYQQLKKENKQIIKDPNSNILIFKDKYPSLKNFENSEERAGHSLETSLQNKEQQTMKINGITIFKNKTCNTWYTRYRKDGKQHYISGKTQKEVAEKLKDNLNIIKKEKQSGTTLEQWYNKWLELYKIGKVKQATLDDYKKSIKHIPNEILIKNIKQIKIEDIIQVLQSITKERAKQKVYDLLTTIFEKAKNHKLIKDNILNLIDKPKVKREEGIALDIEQQKLFIKACDNNKYGELFKLILFQGLRIGEALALTGNDIDLDNQTLTINKAVTKYNVNDTTKNEQSNRLVPIFKPSNDLLHKYKKYNNQRIFNISYDVAQKQLKQIIKKNKLENFSIHDLRHTFITNCKNENISEHIIQRWVGHKIGSNITSNIYTHVTNDANLLNINKLNNSKFYSNSTQ